MSENKQSDATTNDQSNLRRPQIKHDWYQADTYVTINVLVKNLDESNVKVSFEEKSVIINLPSDDLFTLNLSKQIVPSKSSYRIKPTKIELKLKKLNDDLWTSLETKCTDEKKEVSLPHTNRNWDKLVETELKDDASEGEAALNELFQKIYRDGSDEVKKAMNKSFMESGGTVLSTNWNEVGEKPVEIKPPDGMEYKKWDQP